MGSLGEEGLGGWGGQGGSVGDHFDNLPEGTVQGAVLVFTAGTYQTSNEAILTCIEKGRD